MLSKAGIQLLGEIWDKFGLATILVGIAVATWFGWIASPFSEAKDLMVTHISRMEDHLSHDSEILFYLKQVCQSNAKLANQPIEICNWDPRDR
jgi:hypothetical protein